MAGKRLTVALPVLDIGWWPSTCGSHDLRQMTIVLLVRCAACPTSPFSVYFKSLSALPHFQVNSANSSMPTFRRPHMAKSGRFPHLHTSPFFLMASMCLSISMAIFQKFAILEIIEFLVNLRCAKIYPNTVFSSIPKFQFTLI